MSKRFLFLLTLLSAFLHITAHGQASFGWFKTNQLTNKQTVAITGATKSGGVAGFGGGSPAGNNSNLQGKSRSNFVATGENGVTGANRSTVSFNQIGKGPNPTIDIRAYCARTFAATTTASITAGSKVATLRAASGLINCDGIVIRGAGTIVNLATPSAPRVIAGVAANLLNTGMIAAKASGSTPYQYQVVARTRGGGYTAASSVTAISNGPGRLGSSTVSVSSWTRVNNVVTVTTSSAHNLVSGALVNISGDGGIAGWYQITAAPSSTSFTVAEGFDTRNGASSSGSTGGTVTWFNGNHIAWAAVPNAWQYLIYGRKSGSMMLIGVSHIDNPGLSGDPLYNTFDDFGSIITTAPGQPDWVPLTPPVSAKNNDLVTTIVSGGGTTSVVLAAAASNTVSGAVAKFDNTPNLIAAAQAAASGTQTGVLSIPATPGTCFATNSVLAFNLFPNTLSVQQAGCLQLGDTMSLQGTMWVGFPRNPLQQPQFGFQKLPQIASATASPMIYSDGNDTNFSYISIVGQSANAQVLWLQDKGRIPSSFWDHVQFSTNSNTDFSSQHLVIRNNISGAGGFGLSYVNFIAGPQITDSAATPLFQATQGLGPFSFDHIFLNRRGMYLGASTNGTQGTLDWVYEQGAIMPKITLANTVGGVVPNVGITIQNSIEDTTTNPLVTYLGGMRGVIKIFGTNGVTAFPIVSGDGSINVNFTAAGASTANLGQNVNYEVNAIAASAIDGVLTASPVTYPEKILGAALSVGSPYQVFVNSVRQAAPTCSVGTGGTVPIGSYSFNVAPVFSTGGEGSPSPASATCAATAGKQTLTINWPSVSGATGYDLYANGFSFQCTAPWVSGTQNGYVWSGAPRCGQGMPSYSGSGPTALTAAGVAANQVKVAAKNGGGAATIVAPSLSANRAINLPDAGGTLALASGATSLPGHVVITKGDGSIQDSGVSPMNVYDGMNRANGAIQSGNPNWTALTGTLQIVNNAVGGNTTGQNYAIYNGVSFLSDDQTVSVTGVVSGSTATQNLSLLLRFQNNATLSGYGCQIPAVINGAFSGIPQIVKWLSGSYSSLATGASGSWPNGTRFSCNVTGTTLIMYANGTQIVHTGDSSLASGFPGIGAFQHYNGKAASLQVKDFMASFGATSLNTAQAWSAIQTFTPGIKIGSSATLTGVSGTSPMLASTTGTLTKTKLKTADANGNITDTSGAGTLGIMIPRKIFLPGCLINATTAAPAWNLPTSNAPSVSAHTGTNVQECTLDFGDGQSAQYTLYLPADWTGVIDARLFFFDPSTSGTVMFQVATVCTATSGSSFDDLAFNSPDSFTTITLNATSNALWETTKAGINATGCSPGNKLQIKISRGTDTAAGVARFSGLELTTRAAI